MIVVSPLLRERAPSLHLHQQESADNQDDCKQKGERPQHGVLKR